MLRRPLPGTLIGSAIQLQNSIRHFAGHPSREHAKALEDALSLWVHHLDTFEKEHSP